MSEHLPINIDPEVFKIKDDKVTRLLASKITLELFSMLIKADDPYILIGNTIYALTEQEFYALRGAYTVHALTDDAFKYVIDLDDLSFMSDKDRAFVEDVKKGYATCSSCQYKRNKDVIEGLVNKYKIDIPEHLKNKIDDMKGNYPPITSRIVPKAFNIMGHKYNVPVITRKSCLDCVEKHVAQAYVLSRECMQGYPDHLAYVVGHLGEALDELPGEMSALRDTLEFCLARTNCFKRPFVPLGALIKHIEAGRVAQNEDVDQDIADDESKFELGLTDGMRKELGSLDSDTAEWVASLCGSIDNEITLGVENRNSSVWLGKMACISDRLVDVAPLTANLIRLRRLIFSAAPDLMAESGYGMTEISDFIKTREQA